MYDYVKLSFKDGFNTDIVLILNDCIEKKTWESRSQNHPQQMSGSAFSSKLRTGIMGIERSIQEKQKATNETISIAFEDLNKLMSMAKDMVNLSKIISNKIRVS